MNYFTVLFVFGCVLQFASSKECKGDDLGAEVPADICDNSRCQKLSTEDLNMIGNQDVDLYTWNIANKVLTGYCDTRFTYTIIPNPDNTKVTGNLTLAIRMGEKCDETYDFPVPLTGEPDPSTGEFTFFTSEGYGGTWEICHPFYIPGGPFVYRACRTNPPPEKGSGFASIFVLEPAEGDCQRNAVNEFLESYNAKWKQVSVDCEETVKKEGEGKDKEKGEGKKEGEGKEEEKGEKGDDEGNEKEGGEGNEEEEELLIN